MNAKDKLKRDPVWRRILGEYKAHISAKKEIARYRLILAGLCNAPTFHEVWQDWAIRDEICQLARDFLDAEAGHAFKWRREEDGFRDGFYVGAIMLFNYTGEATFEMLVAVRMAFLEYLISHESHDES